MMFAEWATETDWVSFWTGRLVMVVLICGFTWFTGRYFVRKTVKEQVLEMQPGIINAIAERVSARLMDRMLDAMSEKLDEYMKRTDALLFLTELHTKNNEEWKKRLHQAVAQVKAEQEATKVGQSVIIEEVKKTPEVTAEKVVEKVKEESGSYDGTTLLSPKVQPQAG